MSEDGWPYPDDDDVAEQLEPIDLRSEADDDVVALHALPRRALAELSPAEQIVIVRRFGLDGQPPGTLSELQDELELPREQVRLILSDGLEKLRMHLTA